MQFHALLKTAFLLLKNYSKYKIVYFIQAILFIVGIAAKYCRNLDVDKFKIIQLIPYAYWDFLYQQSHSTLYKVGYMS